MSQHQKGYSYFVGVARSEEREGKRGKWSGKRQLTHPGARSAGRRKEERGQQVQVVQWQWARWRSMCQQALAAGPVLAPPGRVQRTSGPHCSLPGRWAQVQLWLHFLARQTPLPAPCLLLLLLITGKLVWTTNCLGHMQTLKSSLGHEYKTLPHFLGQAKPPIAQQDHVF